MTRRERIHKSMAPGMARRKLVVTGYRFGPQPIVELRVHDTTDPRAARDAYCDLTLNQARGLLRVLGEAISAAENAAPRRDGSINSPAGREPAGEAEHGSDATP